MAITTDALYRTSLKQRLRLNKGPATGVLIMLAETTLPAAGTLAGTDTTSGVIPDSTTAGVLPLSGFGGRTGYLAKLETNSQRSTTAFLYDQLYKAGAYAFNATQTLSAQPALTRVPGSNYRGLHLIIEVVTAFTGNPTITIDYQDENNAAQTTSISLTAPAAKTWWRVPLVGEGIQRVNTVTATVASVGTFNVVINRRLGMVTMGDVIMTAVASNRQTDSYLLTGLPVVYDTSALVWYVVNLTLGAQVELLAEVAVG